jgi:hypothetical protein
VTDYRATMRVELVDDRPTFAELVIESNDGAVRHAAWPVHGPPLASLGAAASKSMESLAARAASLGEELLRAAGLKLLGRWVTEREIVPGDEGGTCGSMQCSASVSGTDRQEGGGSGAPSE